MIKATSRPTPTAAVVATQPGSLVNVSGDIGACTVACYRPSWRGRSVETGWGLGQIDALYAGMT